MAHSVDFEQVIIQGIKDLPKKHLGEVASFVTFLRQKSIKSYNFKEDLSLLSDGQVKHLEEEFKDFDLNFPKE